MISFLSTVLAGVTTYLITHWIANRFFNHHKQS